VFLPIFIALFMFPLLSCNCSRDWLTEASHGMRTGASLKLSRSQGRLYSTNDLGMAVELSVDSDDSCEARCPNSCFDLLGLDAENFKTEHLIDSDQLEKLQTFLKKLYKSKSGGVCNLDLSQFGEQLFIFPFATLKDFFSDNTLSESVVTTVFNIAEDFDSEYVPVIMSIDCCIKIGAVTKNKDMSGTVSQFGQKCFIEINNGFASVHDITGPRMQLQPSALLVIEDDFCRTSYKKNIVVWLPNERNKIFVA
jgi:hypothetical protein